LPAWTPDGLEPLAAQRLEQRPGLGAVSFEERDG
jgi:hypothetical protein